MGDAGGESVKEAAKIINSNYRHSKKKRSGFEDFTLSIAKVAVAQICEAAGFQGFQRSALDTLSDVGVRYIKEIGRTSNMYANLACRSQANVFDIIQGLEDLGSMQGFSGASDVHHCLLSSGTVRDMVRYIGEAEEIPFAYSIPEFPVVKERESHRSFVQTGGSPPDEHIPSWLPAFPDPETYVHLHSGDLKAPQTREDEVEQVEKRREADRALANLQQQMTCNRSAPSVAVDFADATKGKGSVGSNPFRAPPLQHGEKEVSLVLLPAKLSDEAFVHHNDHAVMDGHISAMKAFAPAIEVVKSGIQDAEDGKEKVPLKKPDVRFKFQGSRKSFHIAPNSENLEVEKIGLWFNNDDVKHDKRRAE